MAVSSTNIPCKNPSICGVKTHRPGTIAACSQASAGRNGGLSKPVYGQNAPKLASSLPDDYDPRDNVSVAGITESIRHALGPNGYRKIKYENHAPLKRIYEPRLTFHNGVAVPPKDNVFDPEPYGNDTIEVYRGVMIGGEWGVEGFTEEPGSEQSVPDVIGLGLIRGSSPSSRDYADSEVFDAEHIPGLVDSDGVVAYVRAQDAGAAIEAMIKNLGYDRGEGNLKDAYGGLPNWEPNSSHPLEFWPRHVELPETVAFEEHLDYWSPSNDPQEEESVASVKTFLTMKNGATATYIANEANDGPQLEGAWDEYHVWDKSEAGERIKQIASDYAEQADSSPLGEVYTIDR